MLKFVPKDVWVIYTWMVMVNGRWGMAKSFYCPFWPRATPHFDIKGTEKTSVWGFGEFCAVIPISLFPG